MPAGLLIERCNPYGAETGGAGPLLGGLSTSRPTVQWACKKRAIGHFRMTCEHGHRGQMMPLCEDHARKFKLRPVQFCPRCNATDDHRCALTLTEIS